MNTQSQYTLTEADMNSLADIQELTCRHFGVKLEDLRSAKRHREIARPRMIAMKIARDVTSLSLPQIGRYFHRDHTTVIHAIRRIPELMAEKEEIANDVKAIRAALASSVSWRARAGLQIEAAKAIAEGLAGGNI